MSAEFFARAARAQGAAFTRSVLLQFCSDFLSRQTFTILLRDPQTFTLPRHYAGGSLSGVSRVARGSGSGRLASPVAGAGGLTASLPPLLETSRWVRLAVSKRSLHPGESKKKALLYPRAERCTGRLAASRCGCGHWRPYS